MPTKIGIQIYIFSRKIRSNINVLIKISEAIYLNDGDGYFENSNLLLSPDFEALKIVSQQKA